MIKWRDGLPEILIGIAIGILISIFMETEILIGIAIGILISIFMES